MLILAAAIVAAAGVVVCLGRAERQVEGKDRPQKVALRSRRIKEAKISVRDRIARIDAERTPPAEKPDLKFDADDRLSAVARKLAEDMQKALDEEDFAEIQRVIENVIKSRDILLMRKAIAAASWFGPKALPELTGLAAALSGLSSSRRQHGGSSLSGAPGLVEGADEGAAAGVEESPAEEIVDMSPEEFEDEVTDAIFESMSAIEAKLGEIENLDDRAAMIAEYMKSSSSEKTQILLSGQLKAILDECVVLNAVVEVIENGGTEAAIKAAKEVYEFETGGEPYTGIDAAEQWLQENYTPPEPDGE